MAPQGQLLRHQLLHVLALFATYSSVSSFIVPETRSFTRLKSRHRPTNRYLHATLYETHQLIAQGDLTSNLLQTYSDLLRLHPLPTKSITAAILACIGDAIAQRRSTSESYDIRRGIAFLLFGASYTGAFQHYWFNYLSQHIAEWGDFIGVWGPEHANLPVDVIKSDEAWWRYFDLLSQLEHPPSPQALAAGKLVLNQFVVVPLVYMPLFFSFTGLISGLDVAQSVARARSLYFPILRRNYFFWLPVQFLQFLVIPIDFQIPFVSAASLVWTVIISSIGGGSTAPQAPSSIVVYETQEKFGEEIVTVSLVDPGPINEVTDDVMLQDITNALIPDQLTETVNEVAEIASNDVAILTSGGLAAGLLAAAADEALIGETVGGMIGVEAGVGVAIVTAASGLAAGLLASAANDGDDDETGLIGETNVGLISDESAILQDKGSNETTEQTFQTADDEAVAELQEL